MKSWIRTPFAFAALAAAISFGACSDDEDPTGGNEEPPLEVTVEMGDNFFDQQEVRVKTGGTVTWVNAGERDHTSTSDEDIWDSELLSPGEDFTETFPTAGTFDYHCIPHQNDGMLGTVIVEQ